MAAVKLSLKLVVEKRSQRLLFAEAESNFVDFLFSIFTVPIGTVTRLLKEEGVVGPLPSLYNSIENLSDACFLSNQSKGDLLNPRQAIPGAKVPLLLPNAEKFTLRKIVSRCSTPCSTYSIDDVVCDRTDVDCDHFSYKPSEAGFVKRMVTYMVMDDLEVKPMTTISGITLLNEFSVKEVGAIEEKVVHLGIDEGVKLLKASLQSNTVLTDVFLSEEVKRGTNEAAVA
ncbi:hypothetical protein CJ030_MR3G014628 [Morella rubra]|uniref:DUF674 domain-containing protein n=1 Tax=Morella rubra TaxID=262757 RepID=A0A6A1VYE0_9ROSI|nr:hypothetical protein CJ030_MR3G014628 [Morella rubra]